MSLVRSFVRRAGVYVWHTLVCAAVLVVAVSVFWAGAYSLSVHSRRQAERMLQQLAAVQPGVASSIHAFGKEKEEILSYGNRTENQIEATSDGIAVNTPHLTTPGGGEALEVYLSPKASPDIRRAGFDLNLRWATAISLCTQLCQLAPFAWHSHGQFMKSKGLTVGRSADCSVANHQ